MSAVIAEEPVAELSGDEVTRPAAKDRQRCRLAVARFSVSQYVFSNFRCPFSTLSLSSLEMPLKSPSVRLQFARAGRIFIAACLGAVAMTQVSVQGHAQDVESNIRQFCYNEWPNDYSMEEYCQKKEREDLAHFNALVGQYQGNPEFIGPIVTRCTSDWTDAAGLTDYSMLDYCTTNEVEAAQRLGKAPPAGIGGLDARTMPPSTSPSPAPAGDLPRLTFGDLADTWTHYIGKRVIIVSAQISRASRDQAMISGEGGFFWARSPWRREEDGVYLLKNCSGEKTSERCRMPVSGVVRQFGADLVMIQPLFSPPD